MGPGLGAHRPGIQSSQVVLNTYASGITAAGGGQGGATTVSKSKNRVDTVTANNDGVILSSMNAGEQRTIQNNCGNGNNLKVYPIVGGNFLGLAANVALDVADGNEVTTFCYAASVGTLI